MPNVSNLGDAYSGQTLCRRKSPNLENLVFGSDPRPISEEEMP